MCGKFDENVNELDGNELEVYGAKVVAVDTEDWLNFVGYRLPNSVHVNRLNKAE